MKTDFDQIKFNPSFHTYTCDDKRLKNVTSLVSKVKRPFDREGMSAKKAQERGITQAEILAEWDGKATASREKGTFVHEHIEQVLTNGLIDDPILALNETLPEVEAFNNFWSKAAERLIPYKTEWIVGDIELGIAGMVDAVMFCPGTGQHHILDWKTGKLESENGFGNMLQPFDHLDDCSLNHYSLQLSIYQIILQRNTELDLGPSYLVHLTDTFRIVKARDLMEAAQSWLS